MNDDVLFEVSGGVGRITLNRPRQINALTTAMLAGIGDRLADWIDDDSVERVLLAGAGGARTVLGGGRPYPARRPGRSW